MPKNDSKKSQIYWRHCDRFYTENEKRHNKQKPNETQCILHRQWQRKRNILHFWVVWFKLMFCFSQFLFPYLYSDFHIYSSVYCLRYLLCACFILAHILMQNHCIIYIHRERMKNGNSVKSSSMNLNSSMCMCYHYFTENHNYTHTKMDVKTLKVIFRRMTEMKEKNNHNK